MKSEFEQQSYVGLMLRRSLETTLVAKAWEDGWSRCL